MTKKVDEKTLEIIRKLLALADKDQNSSTHEAELAMQKAHAMMRRYGLELAEIIKHGEKIDVEQWQSDWLHQLDTYKKYIIHAVCKLFDCEWLTTRSGASNKYKLRIIIVGEPTDVAVAVEAFTWLTKKCERIARQSYGSVWGVRHRCFVEGFGSAIHNRASSLKKMQKQQAEESQGQPESEEQTWALVVVQKNEAVTKYMQQVFPDLKTKKGNRGRIPDYDHNAAQHGRMIGQNEDLSFGRSLGNTDQNKLLS